MELKKRGLEAMLEGELTDHPGYEPNHSSGNGTGNSRNGRNWMFPVTTMAVLSLRWSRNGNADWRGWKAALNQFIILFGDRVPV